MARGSDQANAAATSGLGYSRALQGQQGSLYGTLAPALTADVYNPQGLTPTQKATANTAAQQSAGGSMAGATGQGALLSQRTRNAGTADAAIAESARAAGRNLSNAALGTELEDVALKNRKQAAAKGELGSLYGMSGGEANQALGQTAENVRANAAQEDASWGWAKYILDPVLAAGGQAGAAKLAACWIAETLYGVDDPRTWLLRFWLNGPFSQHWYGKATMAAYRRFGRWIATRPRIAFGLKPLFEAALRRAKAWDSQAGMDL